MGWRERGPGSIRRRGRRHQRRHLVVARLAEISIPEPDGAERLDWWRTAASYHLAHALALGLVAVLIARSASTALSVAGFAFLVGIALFSGSLYAMVLSGVRGLGAVTPIGGLAFLVGWGALAWAAMR